MLTNHNFKKFQDFLFLVLRNLFLLTMKFRGDRVLKLLENMGLVEIIRILVVELVIAFVVIYL
jgi:hypothetical protein